MAMRECGGCTLCCKLLPVRSIDKPGGVRCRHQKFGKGCAIYHKLAQLSPECVLWNCRWLVNDDAADLRRPDRSHFVIDIMPDIVYLRDDRTGAVQPFEALQVWVDPTYREAHRDPALRAYIDRRGRREGMMAIIRFSSNDGFVLCPPSLAADGQWHEDHSPALTRQEMGALASTATADKVA